VVQCVVNRHAPHGTNPIQRPLIAGESQAVVAQHYTQLTKEDAYEGMIRVPTTRRT